MSASLQARQDAAAGALVGVIRTAEDLAGRAQRLAPVDEGPLRASAAIVLLVDGARFESPPAGPDGPSVDASARAGARAAVLAAAAAGRPVRIDAEVSFSQVYAARQHEELTWKHPKGGQAKYLQAPLLEQADRYERIIALAAEAGEL